MSVEGKMPPARIQRMLNKSAGIRATADIPQDEAPKPADPQTPVGMRGALAAAQARIAELEAQSALGELIPLNAISANPKQPRRHFDQKALQALADSIKEQGLMQPVLVRRVAGHEEQYHLVVGERRFRAHQLNNAAHIKAIVVDLDDADMALWALSENINREDLSDYEIAQSLLDVAKEFPTKTRMAEELGMARPHMYRYFKFQKLPDFVLEDLAANRFNLGASQADDIARVLEQYGEPAKLALAEFWPKVVAKELEQTKLAAKIEARLSRNVHTSSGEASEQKLQAAGKVAGLVRKDGRNFTVKIKTAMLNEQNERELRALLARMFPS